MRISSILFSCIKNELNIRFFPFINMSKVNTVRQWKNYSPEKRLSVCKKMSHSALVNFSNENKKQNLMSKGMKKYWKTVSTEKRKAHIGIMSKGMKKAWKESDETFKSRIGGAFVFQKRINIDWDVSRINTYSGVITESEMEEINA